MAEDENIQTVIVNGGDHIILGIPESAMQGPGIYQIKDGQIVSFAPFSLPVEALGSPTEALADETGNQSAETGQAGDAPAPQGVEAPTGDTLG
jgi:hypothetical protein